MSEYTGIDLASGKDETVIRVEIDVNDIPMESFEEHKKYIEDQLTNAGIDLSTGYLSNLWDPKDFGKTIYIWRIENPSEEG